MNPIILLGGILLGVLVALSALSRYSYSTSPVKVIEKTQTTEETIVKRIEPTPKLKPVPAVSNIGKENTNSSTSGVDEYMRSVHKHNSVASAIVETQASVTTPMKNVVSRVTDIPNPVIPYHSQASIDFNTYKAYIPTLDLVNENIK